MDVTRKETNDVRQEFTRIHQCRSETDDLKPVVERMVEEIAMHSSCIVFITDPAYRGLIDMHTIFEISSFLSKYDVSNASCD
ncbi:uncharacterized protein LOC105276653 [Ooceraea biroi]|uniref:uncharacterized protein LOC105276653 n=1 Tax=Ooceraea biroi TaxID=2015173 RepID=UPI000F0831FE|nr:uncharacterized protein LOC105276653 [Ooceraea biroi]